MYVAKRLSVFMLQATLKMAHINPQVKGIADDIFPKLLAPLSAFVEANCDMGIEDTLVFKRCVDGNVGRYMMSNPDVCTPCMRLSVDACSGTIISFLDTIAAPFPTFLVFGNGVATETMNTKLTYAVGLARSLKIEMTYYMNFGPGADATIYYKFEYDFTKTVVNIDIGMRGCSENGENFDEHGLGEESWTFKGTSA